MYFPFDFEPKMEKKPRFSGSRGSTSSFDFSITTGGG